MHGLTMNLMLRLQLFLLSTLITLLNAPNLAADSSKSEADNPPLVSATMLDTKTATEISERYPEGITIYSDNLSTTLESQLGELERSGYKVVRTHQNNALLQQLTTSVIEKSNLEPFLRRVYTENPGCPGYMSKELLIYGLRSITPSSLDTFQQLTESDYRQLINRHHFWRNLGFEDKASASEAVTHWLERNARSTSAEHSAMLDSCGLQLNHSKLELFGQLVGLDYLSNAVRGLFYRNQNRPLTHYRQVAVDTLKQLSDRQSFLTDKVHQD